MKKVRTLFISDVHLGTKKCQADKLLEVFKNLEFENLVIDIVDKNLEIPKVYDWWSTFNEVRKKHFKNNRTTKVNKPYPWIIANTWEDSLTTQLYMSLFH